MSDLALGQPAWDKLFREKGFFFAIVRVLRDLERRFADERNREQVVEENDINGFTSNWALSGVDIGTNTDEDALLYVRITDENPGAGQALVELYKATGGGAGDLVATGSANDGATVTLAAANSSGITGTVDIGTVNASESDDNHRLRIFPDFAIRARQLFDFSEDGHQAALDAALDAFEEVREVIAGARDTILSAMDIWLDKRLGSTMKASDPESGNLRVGKSVSNVSGVVTSKFVGLLEILRDNMEDETTPAAQTVIKATVSAGAGAFDGGNDGKGTAAAATLYEFAQDGLITFVCVDDTIGAEKFAASQRLDDTNEVLRAEQRLQVKKAWASPRLGVQSLTVVRTLSLSGAANDFGVVGDWSIDGEDEGSTDGGTIYLQIEESSGGGTFRVNGYSDSARTNKVFTTDYVAAGATPAIQAVGSNLSGTAKVGAAPTDTNTGSINLQVFKKQNTAGVPDKFTVDITRSDAGIFQKLNAEELGYRYNSAASGAETIDDSYATAGSFPPYSVEDA